MDLQFVYDFLSDLANHNKKEWMDDNKKRYLEAKGIVIDLVAQVIEKASAFDPTLEGIDPKKTLFRINRDIRFSKNKDPYKTNFGASIVDGGRRSGNPGYYIHIKSDNNFVGGGVYQPAPDILQKVRQEIDYNGNEVKAIIGDKKFKAIYPSAHDEDKLKTAPKGYPKDHENIDLLQLKHYVYMRNVSNKEMKANDVVGLISNSFQVLHPFNEFLRRAMD
ncbi:MAG: DUF2461 domain-containing protein [Bacteroidota bacterium]